MRLTTTASSAVQNRCPSNEACLFGSYWQARCAGGRIWVQVSDSGRPPFDRTVAATPGPFDSEGRVVLDARRRAVLIYTRKDSSGNTFTSQTYSEDDGISWSTPTDMITGGSHPTHAKGYDGGVLFAAYVSGKIKGLYQEPGDLTPSSGLFTFKDSAGADLLVANDTFGLVQTYDLQARWWLHVQIAGEGSTSSWFSCDEGVSWARSS